MKTPLLLLLLLLPPAGRAADSPVPWRHADPRLVSAPRTVRPLRTVPNVAERARETRGLELTRLLRDHPEDFTARKELAALRMEEDRDDEAARLWYEVARIRGGDREALSGLAACMLRSGSHDPAARLLSEMRERGLASPPDRISLAYAQFSLGRFELAAGALREVAEEEEKKEHPARDLLENCWYDLAVVAYSLDQPVEAGKWLDKIRDAPPP